MSAHQIFGISVFMLNMSKYSECANGHVVHNNVCAG